MEILCSVDHSHPNSSLTLHLAKGPKILWSSEREAPYRKLVLAADAGEYECNALMKGVSKVANGSLMVKGEKYTLFVLLECHRAANEPLIVCKLAVGVVCMIFISMQRWW